MKISSLVTIGLFVAPVSAYAQAFVVPPSADIDKYGCTGFAYQVTLSHVTHTAETMTVTKVDSLSPAAVAGLQVGDSITAIDNVGIGDASIGAHWRKPVGTQYVLQVRRAGADRAITLKSGRLGPEPTRADQRRVCNVAEK
jgi:C-terminal processing protease CtpA/Prc